MVALSLVALVVGGCPGAAAGATAAVERKAIVQIGGPRHVPSALDSVPHPWPGRALLLSAAGAALPVVLVTLPGHQDSNRRPLFFSALAAEVVTPAAGHLYAGLTRRAGIGMIARAVGFGVAIAGGVNRQSSEDLTYGDLAMLFGATMIGVSAIWDVAAVPSDVERRNRDWLDAHASVGLRALPDGRAPALAVIVRF
jgi:hypothetical protein